MKNFSVTITGVLIAVAGPMLAKVGFSDVCSSEMINYIIPIIGGAVAWVGRYKAGGITLGGFKK